MFDDTDISLLLVLIVVCAALTRPAMLDIVGYAVAAAALGTLARAAAAGATALPDALRAAIRSRS